MAAGVDDDVFVPADFFFDVGGQAVKVAEGRHGPDLTIGEELLELLFARQLALLGPGGPRQFLEVHQPGGGQRRQGEATVQLDDHHLDELVSGDVHLGGQLLGGEGRVVLHHVVAHAVLVQEFLQAGGDHRSLLTRPNRGGRLLVRSSGPGPSEPLPHRASRRPA